MKNVTSSVVPRTFQSRARTLLLLVPLLCSCVAFVPELTAQTASRVVDGTALQPGAIEGVLVVGTKPIAGTSVMIRETGQSTLTDKYGIYRFSAVAPGTYTLAATADGYQRLHITDVVVRPGSALTLSQVQMHKPVDGVVALEPYVVKGEANNTIELDKYLVEGSRAKPFQDANVDIPRTINDAQPYYIFDSKTIDQSGAVNVEEFLKNRLTMNGQPVSNSQLVGASSSVGGVTPRGNTSNFNLRGLGTDMTLILINGRRSAALFNGTTGGQPDLNGLPLSAIDRIEVLPTSASGIYGASALGGVINVVLKRNFSGGEISLKYDNTWDSDAPRRTAGITWGTGAFGGKTQIMLNAQWSDSQSLQLRDRKDVYLNGLNRILKNKPTFIYSSVFLGSRTNIATFNGTDILVLKDGRSLGSPFTHISAGISPTTPTATLLADLLANAGKMDLNSPETYQNPNGLLRNLSAAPTTKSFRGSLRQQIGAHLDLTAEYLHTENTSQTDFSSVQGSIFMLSTWPNNPFANSFIALSFPNPYKRTSWIRSSSDSLTVGLNGKLPFGWLAQLDYTKSANRNNFDTPLTSSITDDLVSGALNPFVDTLSFPPDMTKYATILWVNRNRSLMDDFTFRGSGPFASLPWGFADLTIGLEHRQARTPENTLRTDTTNTTFYARKQLTDSGYAELLLPLVKKAWLPLVQSLEVQASARREEYEVDGGTPSRVTTLATGVVSYSAPTKNGQPYFNRVSYQSTNETIALKYQPTKDLILRVSTATAFLPATPAQLVKNPLVDPSLTMITDPKTGARYGVQTISGGNPDLKPQSSRSLNLGIVWTPSIEALSGLRLNCEYYEIEQKDSATVFSTQFLVDNETLFGRVTRDSSGVITLVDGSFLNLYKRKTRGWDLSASYRRVTRAGTFTFDAVESITLELANQYFPGLPMFDAVNFPAEGGAAKYKANGGVRWERNGLNASWNARYFGSYKQYGALGGPNATQRRAFNPAAVLDTTYTAPQGADEISSQIYHDITVGYSFDADKIGEARNAKQYRRLLDGMTVQVGVQNVFNKAPPFDVYYSMYLSPYGDTRLRSYWVNLKKAF